MAYEKKEGDFVLFEQLDKKNERGPDWKGDILLNGTLMEIAIWTARSDRGRRITGSVKPKQQQGGGNTDPTEFL